MRPALFLDRDGVINEDRHHVHLIEGFVFLNGIFELCRSASAAGMAIIVVTNQGGIGRGLYSEEQFQDLSAWMRGRFAKEGVHIDGIYHCPYHPEHGIGRYRQPSFDRKPKPGMILRARDDHTLVLEYSVLIGDKECDIAAADAAGIGTTVLLADPDTEVSVTPDFRVRTLHEANRLLFQGKWPGFRSTANGQGHTAGRPSNRTALWMLYS